jgi:hypothetical protein
MMRVTSDENGPERIRKTTKNNMSPPNFGWEEEDEDGCEVNLQSKRTQQSERMNYESEAL